MTDRRVPEIGRPVVNLRICWLVAFAVACLLGAVEAGQIYLKSTLGPKPALWSEALAQTLPSWLLLGSMTPAVVWLAFRYPLGGGVRLKAETTTPWVRSFPAHLVGAVAFALIHITGTAGVVLARGFQIEPSVLLWKHLTSYFAIDLLVYAAIVGAAYAVHYQREARARTLAAAELQASLTDARLQALRAQLNPHFLFNTLNAISVLALKGEQEGVVQTLSRLSDLLRLSLDEGLGQEVPLAKELEFTDLYLDIQRVRFADRLTVRREIEPAVLDALVPSMILQPLVENAIVHGLSARPGPGAVELRASHDGGRLSLQVRDSGPGFRGSSLRMSADGAPRRPRGDGNGIGLANTRARLEQMYGADFSFDCQDAPGGGASVILTIPLRRAPGAASRLTA